MGHFQRFTGASALVYGGALVSACFGALVSLVSATPVAARCAALWLAFLGPFFFLSYGFANNWAARLGHVPALAFDWGRQIPFLDWTILPYMSIDAFYGLSLFICRSRQELDSHAKRLLCATLISVTGFLLFPLEFSFVRPATGGFNGMLFDVLTGFDKPFNQAPSLHVSLLLLLWLKYAQHWRGVALWLLGGWFFLIGVSIFTTYQHHVIDGVAGVAVGVLCWYLFPDPSLHAARLHSTGLNPLDAPRQRQLARRYAAAGVLCCLPAYVWGGWAWLGLWPGFALLMVALAYAGFGTAVFQKRGTRQSGAAQGVLAPYRLGAWCASRWFSRHDAARVEVVPGLWLGRAPGRRDWAGWQPAAVLDLTAEFNSARWRLGVLHENVPMLDLLAPTHAQVAQALAALAALAALTRLHAHAHAHTHEGAAGGPVLVHCALGYSRSALVLAAWLMQRGLAHDVAQAVAQLKAVRPGIVLPPSSLALLDVVAQRVEAA